MRIRTHVSPQTHEQGNLRLPHTNTPGSLNAGVKLTPQKNPLEALEALEQWRVQDEQTAKQRVYWPLEAMPLTVQVASPAQTELPVSPAEVIAVMRQWEAASQGLVRFQLVEFTAEPANILIAWSSETVLGRDFEVGHTNRAVSGKQITQATITLILGPIIDRHLSPKRQRQRLYATILHEAGHALGLEHSENKQDVMYYRGWQRPSLSPGDIQRIQQHYRHRQSLQF